MSRKVPEGWSLKRLGEIMDFQNGFAFKPTDWRSSGLPIVRIQNLNGGSDFNFYDGYVPAQFGVKSEDILFCWSGSRGTSFGPRRWKGGAGWLNQHIFRCDLKTGIDSHFAFYLLEHLTDAIEQAAHGGAGLVHIKKSELVKFEAAMPPLHEQRRIAEILSSVDEAVSATRAVIEQTRKVKQGVLERLLTKGIGHTHFKQTEVGEIPEGWEVTQVGKFARLQPGYAFKSDEFADSGIRLLRGSNIGVGSFDWSEGVTKYFPAERVDEFSEYLLGENDIIIAMDRPFISAGFKVARLKKSDLPCLLLQRVGRLTPTGECDPNWLWQITSAGSVRRHIEMQQVGTDLPHVSRSDIESCTVALPPLAEQKAIATILEPFDTQTDILLRSLSSGERLKSALMSDLLTGRKRVTDALPMAAE